MMLKFLIAVVFVGVAMASLTAEQVDALIEFTTDDGTTVYLDLDPYERLVRSIIHTAPEEMAENQWIWWELLVDDSVVYRSSILAQGRCQYAMEHRQGFMRRLVRKRLGNFVALRYLFQNLLAECSSDALYTWIDEDLPTTPLDDSGSSLRPMRDEICRQASAAWRTGNLSVDFTERAGREWSTLYSEYPHLVIGTPFAERVADFRPPLAVNVGPSDFQLEAEPDLWLPSVGSWPRWEIDYDHHDVLLRVRPEILRDLTAIGNDDSARRAFLQRYGGSSSLNVLYHRAGEIAGFESLRKHLSWTHMPPQEVVDSFSCRECQQLLLATAEEDTSGLPIVWRRLAFQAVFGQHATADTDVVLGEPLTTDAALQKVACLLEGFLISYFEVLSRLDILLISHLMSIPGMALHIRNIRGTNEPPVNDLHRFGHNLSRLTNLGGEDMRRLRAMADEDPSVGSFCRDVGIDLAMVEPANDMPQWRLMSEPELGLEPSQYTRKEPTSAPSSFNLFVFASVIIIISVVVTVVTTIVLVMRRRKRIGAVSMR